MVLGRVAERAGARRWRRHERPPGRGARDHRGWNALHSEKIGPFARGRQTGVEIEQRRGTGELGEISDVPANDSEQCGETAPARTTTEERLCVRNRGVNPTFPNGLLGRRVVRAHGARFTVPSIWSIVTPSSGSGRTRMICLPLCVERGGFELPVPPTEGVIFF